MLQAVAQGFASVFKFNHHHDEMGRFATADGSAPIKSDKVEKVLEAMSKHPDQHPNIMGMRVDGEQPFGNGNLGIARIDMPQIPSALRQQFLDSLHTQVETRYLDPKTLKPTQNELDGYKVGKFIEKMRSSGKPTVPIITSLDGYVLDGHHHWGAKLAERLTNPDIKVPAYVVHMGIKNLLDAAHAFAKAHDIAPKDITKADLSALAYVFKANPYRDAHGRYATAQTAVHTTSMAEDMERQHKFLAARAQEHGAHDLDQFFAEHPNLATAYMKQWRQHHAFKGFGYVFKMNPNHDPKTGEFASGSGVSSGDVAPEESGEQPVAPGTPFTVYRVGNSGTKTLEGRNAANAMGVARFLAYAQDPLSSTTGGGIGDTIHRYEVTTDKEFSKYEGQTGGVGTTKEGTVGRTTGPNGQVAYSFGKGGYTAKETGSVSLKDVHALLKSKGYDSFDDSGYLLGSKLIQEVFSGVKKAEGFGFVFKYNPNHEPAGSPKGGQFAKANGEGSATDGTGSGVSLADYYKARDKHVTALDILAKFSKEERREIEYATIKADHSPTSVTLYTHDGVYTDERKKLHQEIIDSYLNDAEIKRATPADGKPTLIVLGGRGGSGKSSFTNGTLKEFDPDKFIRIDSDEIKARLRPPYEGWNAATVHDESKALVETIKSVLLSRGANVILDVTMSSPSAEKDILRAQANGYRIEGHYMYASREEAATRAMRRYLSDGPSKRGRLVPPKVILENTENEANFDYMKKYFSKWSAYDGMGKTPTLIARGGKE